MQENEFEKNVQQRMEEFRLRPSDEVWNKVSGELERKRKRRVVFFIFLMSGLCLFGYIGYYFSSPSTQHIVANKNSPSETNATSPGQTLPRPPVQDTPINYISRAADSNSVTRQKDPDKYREPAINDTGGDQYQNLPTANTGEPVQKNDVPVTNRSREIASGDNNADPASNANSIKKNGENARQQRNTAGNVKSNDPAVSKKDTGKESEAIRSGEKNLQESKNEITQTEVLPEVMNHPMLPAANADSTQQNNANEAVDKEDELTVASPAGKPRKRQKINWGLDFSIGAVDGRKSALPFGDGQKSMDAAPSFNAPLQGFPGSAGYFPPRTPSPVNPGLGFKIGPVGMMELSRRSKLSLGVQYAYMSTRMKIGSYTPASFVVNNSFSQLVRVNAAYQGVYERQYTNRYHFIQLPVTYHLQLNKGKKLPVAWSAGVSGGYLLTTSGLLYDTVAGGIYYKDRNAYNKFQFNVHTGLDVKFGIGNRVQWSVGPELSMTMNKLVNEPYSKKQYLLYGGLTGRIFFLKKK